MTSGKTWRRTPGSRSKKPGSIPTEVQEALQRRLEHHLHAKWQRAQVDLVVRCRGRFAYVAYLERPRGRGARADEDVPSFPLFRLGYLGEPTLWLFSLFTYSNERYEPCIGASGDFTASPEQAFDCAARLYLSSLS